MKAELKERNGCFEIGLTAETVADAAVLVRMATNRTKELRACNVYVHDDGSFFGYVAIGKLKDSTSAIERAGGRAR